MQALLSALLFSCFETTKPEDTASPSDSGPSDTDETGTADPDTGTSDPPVDTGATQADTGTSDTDTVATEDTGVSQETGGSGDTAVEDTGQEDTSSADTQNALSLCTPSHNDWYDLNALEMDGSELLVTLSYSGGCETHSWELCWDGSIAESYPMQVWLELGHDSANDYCEAYITETLRFDVSSIGTTPTVIHLGGMQTTYE